LRISDIEIHAGGVDRPYKRVSELSVKVSAASMFSAAPTIEDVNLKLQEEAAAIYANAVIDVEYDRGMSLTSYKVLKARGGAVILESADIACPSCAETIKRAAKKCRHCGIDLAHAAV
jgi:hypothetical protein